MKLKIQQLRRQRGWTQQDLARVIDRDRSSISYYEIGRQVPPLWVLVKIARAFGVSVDDLIEKNGSK